MGRPSKRTKPMVEKIINRISVYAGPVRVFFKLPGNRDLVSFFTHSRWMTEDAAYREQFTRARENNLEYLQRQCFNAIHELQPRLVDVFGKDAEGNTIKVGQKLDMAGYLIESQHLERVAKLSMKLAGQMMPRRYKSVSLEHSADGASLGKAFDEAMDRADRMMAERNQRLRLVKG